MKTRMTAVIGLIAVLISACIPVGTAVAPAPTETSTAPIVSVALVQSVEVQILESDPLQVNATVHGQMPDSDALPDIALLDELMQSIQVSTP